MLHCTPEKGNIQAQGSNEKYTYFGNHLHDLESIVTIWKALGMYKKIIKKRHENRPSEQQNQLTLRPQIDTLKTW